LRIARELHDVLGHHLTALSLNLEVATHHTSGVAREHVEKAHALTRVLLTDVREVVSQLRHSEAVDVAGAARSLRDVVSIPRLHVDAPESIPVGDVVGRTALRILQEIVTNAVRHSGANNLWITLQMKDRELHISGRDDGMGTDTVRYGNGLTGMRERIEEAGGGFAVESSRRDGFEVRVTLPGAQE
jgi:signal transduction histidine kinase